MLVRLSAFLLCGAAAAWAQSIDGPAPNANPIADAEFHRLHGELVPAEADAWEKVSWHVDLLAARAQARRENKPLFFWAMNGHPLGCT